MKKVKFFIDLGKEEAWLSQMAQKGFLLRKKGVFYSFSQAPVSYPVIRIDFRSFKNKAEYNEYLTLFNDSGWHLLSGSLASGKQYFIKTSPNPETEIFSDNASKASRYRSIAEWWTSISVTPFIYLITFYLSRQNLGLTWHFLVSPKEWYYTPGLWELSGWRFVWAFLFETPFALLRGGFFYILILMALLTTIYSIVSLYQYAKELKK